MKQTIMASSNENIASGFKEDCENLISRFEALNNIRFEVFCEIWKDMKFSLVFKYHSSLLEILEFCEEALHISKQLFLQAVNFKARIAGLYLLYSVYYKMPVSLFKIRLKKEDWQNIMELHSEIKEGEHLDANYILSKLIADDAFRYCIFDHEFGLEKHFRLKQKHILNPFSVLPSMKNMIESNHIFSDIKELSDLYHKEKCLASTSSGKAQSIKLYDPNFVDEVINNIKALDAERKRDRSSLPSGVKRKYDHTSKGDFLTYNSRFHSGKRRQDTSNSELEKEKGLSLIEQDPVVYSDIETEVESEEETELELSSKSDSEEPESEIKSNI